MQTTLKTQVNVVEKLESGIAALGLLDFPTNSDDLDDDEESVAASPSNDENVMDSVVTGSLNGGQRIDYMLQEREIENAGEYVAALAAHSCYWVEKDLSLFIARRVISISSEPL